MTFPTKNTQGDPLTPVDVLVQLMDGPAEEVRLVSKKPGKGGAIVSETASFGSICSRKASRSMR